MLATAVLDSNELIQKIQERFRDVSELKPQQERTVTRCETTRGRIGKKEKSFFKAVCVVAMLNMIPWDLPVEVTPQRDNYKSSVNVF